VVSVMALPQVDVSAVLVNTRTAAFVSRNGSIDWPCLPRLHSTGPFAALLGNDEGGNWRAAPDGRIAACRRRFRGDTLVLETE
jgi:GH15 family glucan-1,4-alpha-glucosidase